MTKHPVRSKAMTMRQADSATDPVFLDRTGRRRRLFVAAGSVGGLVLLIAAVALVAGFTGTGPGSVPGWPGGTDELRVGRRTPRCRSVPGRPGRRHRRRLPWI
jgi:hypothetical protein